MHQPGVISDYLGLLAGALDFDRSLSRCVRQEVEDHLWEAVADDPAGNTLGAQRRAIENFGDARVIAAQFAVISLAKHSRRVGITAIVMIAGVFIAMKARLAWFAATQWTVCEDMKAVSEVVGSVDRYAFWLSVVIGLGGFAYIIRGGIPSTFTPLYREKLRRFLVLCSVATAALVVCVISDGVLTMLRLTGTGFSADFLLPILSLAIEIAFAGVLAFRIRGVLQHAAATAALSKA